MKFVVIVDAYSAGNLLAPEFKSRGFECLHVQTTLEILPILLATFRDSDFSKKFTYRGDLSDLVNELKAYPLVAVLPGTETGVELADALSAALNLPTNSLELSSARRDKYKMVEAVRAAGLRAAIQLESESIDEILKWKVAHQLSRIVIKPLNSAGTDSVAICSSDKEVETACRAILGTHNKLGLINTHALAQEFLEGTEYFLNTVSCEGRHHFTEIWKYHKRSINGRTFVYDRNELLPFEGPEQQQLREYVLGVLGALKIEHGPAHTEVILTAKGPVLVESGARLDGLSVPSVNNACVGYGPLDLTADSYVDHEEFQKKSQSPFSLIKRAYTVYLTSYSVGTVLSIEGTEQLKKLPSFFQMRLRVKQGSSIYKTVDYFTAPGFLTLVHADPHQLEADYARIRLLENSGGLFQVRVS